LFFTFVLNMLIYYSYLDKLTNLQTI
jgi:hypothetical protein